MKSAVVNGLWTLRSHRLERAERTVNQARAISIKCAEELDELRLIHGKFKSQQPQREEKHFKEYCLKAAEADSLNRYRHVMSNIIEERKNIEERIDEVVRAKEKAEAAVLVARDKHAEADRNLRKLSSMLDILQDQIFEVDRRTEEREMDEWLSIAMSSKIRR